MLLIAQKPGALRHTDIESVRGEIRVLRHLRDVPGVVRCRGVFTGDAGDLRG